MTEIRDLLAKRLRAAYRNHPVPPLRDGLDPLDARAAYDVQAANTRFWTDQGRTIIGRKIGLTAKTVQSQLGVDQPDYGVLFSDMQIENGGQLKASDVLQPKAEAEIAFVFGRDVDGPDAGIAEIAAAIDSVVPAIEIVDSRIADWAISFADTVADNGSSAYFVLGERRPLAGVDLYSCGMVLEVSGAIASLGAGAACLGHPLQAAAWLARTLAELGTPLRAGDIVLTGALGPMTTIKPGDTIQAIVGGIGSCGFDFVDDRA